MLTGSSWATHMVGKRKEKQKGAGPREQGCSLQWYSRIPTRSSPPSCPSAGSPLQAPRTAPWPSHSPKAACKSLPALPTPFRAHLWFGPGTCLALSSPPLTSPSPWSSEDTPPFIKASGARSGQISGISSTFLQEGLSHSCDFLRASERWGPRRLVLGLSCGRQV